MSSLSHSMKVRSSIAALPIGTVSVSGRSVRTKPPTCCDKMARQSDQLLGELRPCA